MTFKLFLSGIDGAGKTACTDLLIARMAFKYRILRIGSYDLYYYFKGGRHLVAKRRLCPKSKFSGTRLKRCFYGPFLVLNLIYKLLTVAYVKLFTKGDLLIYEVDSVLHPAAYITYHFPFTQLLNRRLRLAIVGCLSAPKRTSVRVYLDVDPEIAVERINKRGTDGGSHENLKDLTQIKAEIDGLIDVALDSGFEIFKVNTNLKSIEEVASDVEQLVERKMSNFAAV